MDDGENKRAWKRRFEMKRHSKTLKNHARRVEGVTIRHARRFLVNRWDKIREIRLQIIAWLGGVGVLVALVGLQMVWFQRSYVAPAAISGGTYAEAVRGPINTLNPLFATTSAEIAATHLLFSSLYAFDETGHLRGDIATTMANQDSKIFTVKLRPDVKWHDGQPLTAEDITYTVGLMKSTPVRSVMTASWQGVNVRKIDNYTVEFTLPAAYAAFSQALTFAILPHHLLKTVNPASLRESQYSTAPVGSGPFTLRLLQMINTASGHKIVHMDANRDYYRGSPRLDHFQLHSFNTDEGVARALRTAEVSAASDVSSDSAKTIDTKRYDTLIRPVNSGVYAFFNIGSPFVKDKNVRLALQQATDTTIITKKLFGNPQAMYLPFATDQVPGLGNIAPPKIDKKAAEALLDKAGWIKKGNVRMKGQERLHLRIVARKNSDYETALQSLSGQWRQLGIEIETGLIESSDFAQQAFTLKNFDVLLDQLVIGGDPDVFAYWHSRGQQNLTNYGSAASDDLLSSARTTSDSNLRAVKYVNFARQWLADAPAIGLYQSNLIYIRTKTTQSIGPTEKIVTPEDHYANVRYWTAEQKNLYKTP